jgi:vacuolar-type H+-ATPase catalytic subunit A/Vma1
LFGSGKSVQLIADSYYELGRRDGYADVADEVNIMADVAEKLLEVEAELSDRIETLAGAAVINVTALVGRICEVEDRLLKVEKPRSSRVVKPKTADTGKATV